MTIVNCVKCGNPVMQFEEMKIEALETLLRSFAEKIWEGVVEWAEQQKEKHDGKCVQPEYYASSGWRERDSGYNQALEDIIKELKIY